MLSAVTHAVSYEYCRCLHSSPGRHGPDHAGYAFFGVAGYLNLPVNQLPNVDFPTIQVMADLPGADPETMAASVATPLEKEFFTIAA